jgi:hypothetical protein
MVKTCTVSCTLSGRLWATSLEILAQFASCRVPHDKLATLRVPKSSLVNAQRPNNPTLRHAEVVKRNAQSCAKPLCNLTSYTETHTHTHARTHAHTHTPTRTHTYANTRTCKHTYMQTHTHAHTHTHTEQRFDKPPGIGGVEHSKPSEQV